MDTSKGRLTVLDQITASDKVRRKIIDAASALYAKKGYADTSIQEISDMAGVSLPVTYHYVKKKSEIMGMIMEDVLKIFHESFLKKIKGLDDPEERLAIAVVLFFRVVARNHDKVLLIYQKSGSLDRASKARVMQLEIEMIRIFGEIIAEGIERGIFKKVDVDLTAYNIVMMAHMWVLKKWHFKNRLSLEQYIDLQLLNLLTTLKK